MTSPLAATAAATAAADIHYRVQALDVDAHLFSVQLHIARPAAGQTLSLPVWIPGSYLVREFSKNLQGLSAMTIRIRYDSPAGWTTYSPSLTLDFAHQPDYEWHR